MNALVNFKASNNSQDGFNGIVLLTSVIEFGSQKATIPCRLSKRNKRTGETFVHIGFMGAPFQWNRVEALGTVYPVVIEKMPDIIEDLEYNDKDCAYCFIPA